MRYLLPTAALLILTVSSAFAMATEGCGGDCATCHTMTVKEADTLLKGMGGEVKQVRPAPVRGLWEVTVLSKDNKQALAYVDYGKKHIIPGAIFEIATKKQVTSTVLPPPKPQKVKVSAIPRNNSIILGNPSGARKLFLFTDPDCPFCAKQHAELTKLLAGNPDLAVYVKLNPLKMHPKAYDRSRAILSGTEPAKLLDDAFNGKALPAVTPRTSSAGVDETKKIAGKLGLNSTPTLVLPDGRVLTGFQEAAVIEKALAAGKGAKN
jgi:thiol:disulfide interchange protein DsbC